MPNPISLVSRWKILDNLRRSLVEPATFVLLLFGWFVMGHPVWWTVATVCIMFVPEWVELLFGLTRAVITRNFGVARDAVGKSDPGESDGSAYVDPAGAPDDVVD